MKYKVLFNNNIQKDLRPLNKKVLENFFKIINETISINPFAGIKLKGKYKDLWKYRIGNYRIIYFINSKKNEILILRFRHRKEVYNNII
ncbi:MAG: type II toxin-antitoxin system RelE/ParE family toxin [Cyanobacteria bacterium]|nr:type II toxin-antitoxin system RelE/ParE family toxin [Cyanobacteriota bacterium]